MEECKHCDNCKSQIPLISWELHSAVCWRKNYLCEHCNQIMLKKDKKAHDQEYHSKEMCECGIELEKSMIAEHKEKECIKRRVECKYCEYPLCYDEKRKHEKKCGNRTEPCENCRKRIRLRDKRKHECSDDDMLIDNYEPESKEILDIQCPFCGIISENYEKLQEHVFKYHQDEII